MAAVGSGCWTDAWVLPPPQRALQSRTAPPKVTGLRFTATGPAKTVRYTASQPRPARSFPKDGPPESPLNRHGRSIRAGGRGVDKILPGFIGMAIPDLIRDLSVRFWFRLRGRDGAEKE